MVMGAGVFFSCSYNQEIIDTSSTSEVEDVVMHSLFSEKVVRKNWNMSEGGNTVYDITQVGMGLIRPEDNDTLPKDLPQNDEFNATSTQPFQLTLIINAAQNTTFLVTTLLDYKQVEFKLDGESGLLHEVQFSGNGDLYLPYELLIPEPGAHDLIVMAFVNPFNRPIDGVIRETPMNCLTAGTRSVIIVDNNYKPINSAKPNILGTSPPPEIDFGMRVLFADLPQTPSDLSHPSQRQMKMSETSHEGEEFKYELWLSNYNMPDDMVDYALMRFFDYHQIDFKGEDMYIVHFDGREEAIVEDSVMMPNENGIHEIQIIYVFDPYKSLLRNEVLSRFVFSSSCLGVSVK